MAFDAAKRNGKFGRIQCERSEKSSSRGKRKRQVFLCRRIVRVKVKGKVIPVISLKLKGRHLLKLKTGEKMTVGRIGRSSKPKY